MSKVLLHGSHHSLITTRVFFFSVPSQIALLDQVLLVSCQRCAVIFVPAVVYDKCRAIRHAVRA